MTLNYPKMQTIGIIYLTLVVSAAVCALLTLGVSSLLLDSSAPSTVDHLYRLQQQQYELIHSSTVDSLYPTVDSTFAAMDNTNRTEESEYCPKNPQRRKRRKLVVFLLAFFTGSWGVDRFYTGYVAQGVFKILTIGGLGIWNLVDWILVLVDKRHEKSGCPFYNDM